MSPWAMNMKQMHSRLCLLVSVFWFWFLLSVTLTGAWMLNAATVRNLDSDHVSILLLMTKTSKPRIPTCYSWIMISYYHLITFFLCPYYLCWFILNLTLLSSPSFGLLFARLNREIKGLSPLCFYTSYLDIWLFAQQAHFYDFSFILVSEMLNYL